MAGTPRSAKVREALEARAKAMRLFASGQVKRAREYLLTAQRFVVAAGGALWRGGADRC